MSYFNVWFARGYRIDVTGIRHVNGAPDRGYDEPQFSLCDVTRVYDR